MVFRMGSDCTFGRNFGYFRRGGGREVFYSFVSEEYGLVGIWVIDVNCFCGNSINFIVFGDNV